MATEAHLPGVALDLPRMAPVGAHQWPRAVPARGTPRTSGGPQGCVLSQRRAGRLGPSHPTAPSGALCVSTCSPHIPWMSQHSPTRCCHSRVTGGTVGWHRCLQLQDWLPWPCWSPGPYSQVQLRCLARGHRGEKGGEVPPLKPEQLHSRELKEQNVNQG